MFLRILVTNMSVASYFYSPLNFIVNEQNQLEPLGTVSKRDQPSISHWAPWEMSLRPLPTYQWAIKRLLVRNLYWKIWSHLIFLFMAINKIFIDMFFVQEHVHIIEKRCWGSSVNEYMYIELRFYRYVYCLPGYSHLEFLKFQ